MESELSSLLQTLRGQWSTESLSKSLSRLLKRESLQNRVSLLSEKNRTTGDTVLHVAAFKGHKDIIQTVMSCIGPEYEASQLLELKNNSGSTPIHLAAQTGDNEVVESLLSNINNSGQFYTLFAVQKDSGATALHVAAGLGHNKVIKTMLDFMITEQQIRILKITNRFSQTPRQTVERQTSLRITAQVLGYYADQLDDDSWSKSSWHSPTPQGDQEAGNPDEPNQGPLPVQLIECLVDGGNPVRFEQLCGEMSDASLNEVLADKEGKVFHKLLKRTLVTSQSVWRNIVRDIYQRLHAKTRLQLLKNTDKFGRNPVRRCIKYSNTALIRILLAGLSPTECEEVVCQGDEIGWDSIHDAIYTGGTQMLQVLLDRLSTDRKEAVMSRSQLWVTIGLQDLSALDSLFASFSAHQWFTLASVTNKYGNNVVQFLVGIRDFKFIKFLFEKLTPEQKLELLMHSVDNNPNAIEYALLQHEESEASSIALFLIEQLDDDMIGHFLSANPQPSRLFTQIIREKNDSLLAKFLDSQDRDTIEALIPDIIETQPMTCDQIALMSPYVGTYIVPPITDNVKPFALVCFNTNNRNGAYAEAKLLMDAFAAQGFTVKSVEWRTIEGLRTWLDKQLDKMRGQMSLLFVCCMSHGFGGHVSAGSGSHGEITDLLHQLGRSRLPPHVPLVLLIQACQGFPNLPGRIIPDVDPVEYDPAASSHVILRRPNTALLLATVSGELAIRGAYTGYMADEIRQADGEKDLHGMHQSAVRALALEPITSQMNPEYRDTLKKKLVLPTSPTHV